MGPVGFLATGPFFLHRAFAGLSVSCRPFIDADRLEDGIKRTICQGDNFVVGPILNRVGDEDRGRIKAQRGCLRGGGIDEFGGSDKHRGQSPAFQICDVVHTARRARSSIGQGFDQDVTFADHLLLELGGRHAGKSRLAVAPDG